MQNAKHHDDFVDIWKRVGKQAIDYKDQDAPRQGG
jgi:hypothetical protein